MRISLVGPYHPEVGGVQIYTTYLARELLSLGHDVTVISYSSASPQDGEVVRRSPRVRIPGLRGMSFILSSALSLTKEEPEVALAQYAITSGLACWLASLGKELRYMITFHGSDLRVFPKISRLVSSRAKAVVAVSSWLADQLMRRRIEVHAVIPGGIDPEVFSSLPSKEEARAELGLRDDARVVISVGALVEAKGFDMIPEIAALTKDMEATFLIIGEGPLRRAIEERSSKLGVEDRVKLLGRKEFRETVKYYRAADLLIHPARYEGYGLVALESMAAGTPVVATNVGGIGELIEDGINGFIVGSDPREIADRVLYLLKERDLREEMGAKARERAMRRTWRSVALEYLDLLGRLPP